MANKEKLVCIKNGKVTFVDGDTTKKEKIAAANDSVNKAANADVSGKIKILEKKVDRLLKQTEPENEEIAEMMEALNKIENQGGGGTSTIHSTVKI